MPSFASCWIGGVARLVAVRLFFEVRRAFNAKQARSQKVSVKRKETRAGSRPIIRVLFR